jgi:hypothetical protein
MKIELRAVKYAAFASEETSCFEATIWVDGKRAGTADNEGRGGHTHIHPRELEKTLDAYAATLPRIVTNIKADDEPGGFFTYQPDGAGVIDDLLHDHLTARDLTRALKRHVMFLREGKCYQTKHHASLAFDTPAALAASLASLKASQILNALPFADALAIYKTF